MHLLLRHFPTLCTYSDHRPPPHHHLHFQTSHHKNLRYLKSLKITSPESTTSVSQILSTVEFLKSKGFTEPDFPRISYLAPNLFSPNFNPQTLDPVFEFLTVELTASIENSRQLILKNPHILESDPQFCLKPTLNFLKKLGINRLNVPTSLNAHLLDTRVSKLEEKLRFFEELGFEKGESRRICGRFPAIFGYGIESNLRRKYLYLVKEMKRNGKEEVIRFPQYFGFSLEKRIKVRFLYLKERGVDLEVPLNRMLLWDDCKFYKKWK